MLNLIRERFGIGWALFAVGVVLVANGGLVISEFVGVGAAGELLVINRYVAVPVAAELLWYLVIFGSYGWVERVFLAMTLVFFAYPVSAFMAHPHWGEVLHGTFVPTVRWNHDYVFLLVGLAARLGLRPQGATQSSGGGEGTVAASRALVDTVEIGDVRLVGQSYKVRSFRKDEPDLTLLGLQIFERFVVGISFDDRTLTLTRPEAFAYRGSGQIVPFPSKTTSRR